MSQSRRRSILYILILLCIIGLISACGQSGTPGGIANYNLQGSTLTGTLTEASGQTIYAVAYDVNTDERVVLASATVQSNGKFSLQLPSNPPTSILGAYDSTQNLCPPNSGNNTSSITISPSSFKLGAFFLTLGQQGETSVYYGTPFRQTGAQVGDSGRRLGLR